MVDKTLDKLIISPAIWQGKELAVQPGDLSKFAPYGNGVYGFEKPSFEPIRSDPPQEPNAGVVYFDNGVERSDFEGFLRMMGVRSKDKDYAVFVNESQEPIKDRYFKQMRFVSKFGLRFMFGALTNHEYDVFKEQKLSLGEAVLAFMETEKRRFGTFFGDSRIEGTFGGDGDFAREELSFGFMVENDYNQIYRIWSRAWLVTK